MAYSLPESAPPAFIQVSAPLAEVVEVYDDVDIATADALGEAIQRATDAATSNQSVVVDLTNCKYIDTKGLMQLTNAHRALGKHRFWVVMPLKSSHRRLFDIAGLIGLMNTAASLDDIPHG